MTGAGRNVERLLARHVTPSPSAGLRGKTLHRAGAALERPPASDRWARIRDSRALRLVWAAAIAVLIIANALLPGAARRSRGEWFAQQAAWRAPGLRSEVSLPSLRESYLSSDYLAYRRSFEEHRP